MPATPSRELSITYAGVTVNPDCGPDGGEVYKLTEGFDSFTLDFSFNVTGSTEANFATAVAAARTAFRKPFQDLTVVLGAQTLHSFKQSDNTGLEVRSEIMKDGHPMDTGRSRHFRVRITGGQPADNVATLGLREYSVSVGYSPARRRLVTISGMFTTSTGTLARAVYEAAVDGLATTVKTNLAITTWELIGEDPTAGSYHDQTLSFSRQYHEILYGQGGSGDDANIVEQQLSVTVRKTSQPNAPSSVQIPFPGSGSGVPINATPGQALPLTEVRAQYDCWVTSGFSISGLKSKWESLRTFVLGQAAAAAGSGSYAVQSEEPTYLPDEAKLSCAITIIVVPGSGVLRREFSKSMTKEGGMQLVPAWSGDAYGKYAYQGPKRCTATYRLVEEVAGGGTSVGAGSGGSGAGGTGQAFGGNYGFGGVGSIPYVGFGDLGPFSPGSPIGGNPGAGYSYTQSGSGGASPQDAGGGGGGGGGDSGTPRDSILISDTTDTEPLQFGISSPITITRTTFTRILEYFNQIEQPAGYSAGQESGGGT